MSLSRRIAIAEQLTADRATEDGPINITEAISGQRDLEARRKLGRVGIQDAVQLFRESWEKIDWDAPEHDDFGNPIRQSDDSPASS